MRMIHKCMCWLLALSLLPGWTMRAWAEPAAGDGRADRAAVQPELSARCAVLMGPEGQILYEKDAHRSCPIASTTKLLTALVVLERCDLRETVEIPAECCQIEGSSMDLRPGERYTVEELLTGLLLASGNDAAEALALHCAGDRERFVDWMNERAAALGMDESHFADPHGLPAEDHFGSAADLGRLMLACLEEPALMELLGKPAAEIQGKSYVNHNKLLWLCPGCLGGKTGYTREAGRCLVSCCEREGTRLVCVTLDAPDDWNDHKALYAWGFARYALRDLTEGVAYTVPVVSGARSTVVVSADPLPRFLARDTQLRLRTELPPFVFAPARAGEVCGRVTVYAGDAELGSAPLRFTQDVAAGSCGPSTGREDYGPETAKDHSGLRLDGAPQG
ncbi:MAG: D-alanyl-D-alanine carboxypeptidase [Oscillospiraceae bacterium]|nr:D-alanyl-D-alanine carboxypeptidase [Oscillospiraceae bacterium]